MDTALPNNHNGYVPENEVKNIKLRSQGTLSLNEVLLNEIKFIYYIEKAALKAFPKMIKNACSFDLIEAATIYFEQTKSRIIRIEDAFAHLNEDILPLKSAAVDSLLKEADDIIEDTKFGTVRDIGVVLAFYKIVHLKIAAYTMLSAFSEITDRHEIMLLFADSLNEEKVTELRVMKIINSIRLSPDEN